MRGSDGQASRSRKTVRTYAYLVAKFGPLIHEAEMALNADLKTMACLSVISRAIVWILGTRNVGAPASWLPVYRAALIVLVVAEILFTVVVTVAASLSCECLIP